ncbi:calponin homology domain-containing protein [Elsinoe ampelina]|uniref:Calponin homology domain-containing protein n=1 Tax=Elsinoe ampelina TaxID=302913 RepID=A0A6A6G2T8_9PEZI|nr:calponin homology domain-containing protein [Elsinoe ampelina]
MYVMAAPTVLPLATSLRNYTTPRQSSLSQRARRRSTVNIFEDNTATHHGTTTTAQPYHRGSLFAKPMRRPSLALLVEDSTIDTAFAASHITNSVDVPNSIGLSAKEARRRTIWIPQEDTTVMTIHPGAHTHTLNDETIRFAKVAEASHPPLTASALPNHLVGKSVDQPRPRKGRRSSLLVAPRRAPLAILKPDAANAVLGDIAGATTGKENLTSRTTKCMPAKASERMPGRPGRPLNRVIDQVLPEQSSSMTSKPRNLNVKGQYDRSVPLLARNVAQAEPQSLPRTSVKQQRPQSATLPVLEEDLQHPELFEDTWLAHQEVALTQVINTIFDNHDCDTNPTTNGADVRATYLNLYQQPEIIELHQALSLSVQSAALCLPKQTEVPHLYEDVGLRRQFLSLWLDTYDLECLRSASEAITARLCVPDPANGIPLRENSRYLRKALRQFLTITLLRDAQHDCDSTFTDPARTQWQRTWLRSLSLIHLLDLGHTCRQIPGCLFSKTSPIKSSSDVLKAVAALVCPSINVPRTLGYLGYTLDHIQTPLNEIDYHITNLAVDMRDGVRLARLLDLVADTRIQPDLQYPSPTRMQKMHNVSLSLDMVHQSRNMMHTAASSVNQADIVDGHRQKTVSLLWAVIGRWGLQSLAPLDMLQEEVCHLWTRHNGSTTTALLRYSPSPDAVATALAEWAKLVCNTRGVTISNLTTSFATNAPYVAITDFYRQCISEASLDQRSSAGSITCVSPTRSLVSCMRSLGCSPSFLTLFTSGTTIPSKSTTLCILAWLASKLVPLSRRMRAAVVIQRAWKKCTCKKAE